MGHVRVCLVCLVLFAFEGKGQLGVLEPVAVAFEGQDVGVVDDAVDHGGGDGVVAEDVAPAGEGQVAGQDDRGVLVAAGDELEEQVRGVLLEGDVAHLVDDQLNRPGSCGGSEPAKGWESCQHRGSIRRSCGTGRCAW